MGNETTLMVTWVIIAVIAVMTVYALLSQRTGVAHNAPSILTSLGIFGTFLGITIGLAGFNPDDVANSVSALFAGIKLAFWTSVAGILGGILVKFRHLFLYTEAAETVSLDDLVAAMRGVENSLTDENKQSLVASLRDSQNDMRDQLKSLFASGQAASAEVAGQIDQLSQQLSRQLGDELGEKLAGSAQQSADVTAAQLKSVSEAIQGLREAMGEDSAAMLDRLDQVKAGSEGLGDRLASVLGEGNSGLAQAISRLQDAMAGDTAGLLERMENLRSGSDALGERLSEVLGANNAALTQALQDNRDKLGAQIATAVTDIRDALVGPEGAATALSGQMTQAVQQGQMELAKALARVSEGMRETLDKDMASLNQQLASDGARSAEQMQSVADAIGKLQSALGSDAKDTLARLDNLGAQSASFAQRLDEVMGSNSEALTGAIERLQQAMGGDTEQMLSRMDKLRQGSESLGERLSEVLGANNAALAKAVEGNRDAMAAQVTTAVTDLRDALVGPDGAAKILSAELGARMQQGQVELAKALARTTESLRNALGEDSAAMLSRLDDVGSGMSDFGGSLDALADSLGGAVGEMGSGLSGDVNQLATTVADAVDDLRMAIVGPDGARDGIVEEMRSAHKDTDKHLNAIHKALKENTQRQVDYSPKGLMTVLEELIKQFNTQFAGQFWEKIGGFNQGIAELLEWMETYRDQLDDMVKQQGLSAKHMDTATRRFDEIASKSEIFVDVSRNISNLLGGIDGQRVQIESHLKRFAHIVDETGTTLESIEHRVVEGNQDMNKHLSDIAERIEAQVIRVDRAMDDELKKALVTFGQQLAALSEKFVEDYTPLTDRLREVVSISRGV